MARCFAVAMSHAPGLSGTPVSGHRSSAATRASCASSSARPTSRTIRARPAMRRADSILQTASMARCVSEAAKATDHSMFLLQRKDENAPAPAAEGGSGATLERVLPALRLELLAELLLLLHELPAGIARSKVRRLEHLPDLDLGVLERGALEPFDRLILGLHLPEPEPGDELLGLGEGSVDHGPLPLFELDARALGGGLESLAREHHARFHQLFVELAHVGQHLLAGENARFRVLVGLHNHHEPHVVSPWLAAGLPDDLRPVKPGFYRGDERRSARSTLAGSFFGVRLSARDVGTSGLHCRV